MIDLRPQLEATAPEWRQHLDQLFRGCISFWASKLRPSSGSSREYSGRGVRGRRRFRHGALELCLRVGGHLARTTRSDHVRPHVAVHRAGDSGRRRHAALRRRRSRDPADGSGRRGCNRVNRKTAPSSRSTSTASPATCGGWPSSPRSWASRWFRTPARRTAPASADSPSPTIRSGWPTASIPRRTSAAWATAARW